ncbi:ankyrin repeat domain-containing protein [Aspergillus undulatus]|uniref:ankyrin repeat domain-containing protein n=1 Tax=Aspergillus undulatus TaxID=1810928 RepID=UPI003CCD5C91
MSIFAFVRGRKLPELKQMLQRRPGAVLDASHRQGFSSLHYAFQLESAETIKVLLSAGADPSLEDHWGVPAMYDAFVRVLHPLESTQGKDEDEMRKSLPISIFLDEYNFTHIHRIIVGSRPLRLEAALNDGLYSADVNAQDDMGMTPLHWAALKNDANAVAVLLSAGADVRIRNKRGRTALWEACLINSEACAEKLITFGADVNAGCKYGHRPIHDAAQSNAGGDLLSLLLANGANLEDSENTFGRTPLARAIAFDSARTCKYLLKRGANAHRQVREGSTPFFEAIVKNSHDCLKLLLEWGVDYLHKSRNQTLLHVAAMRGDGRTFEILSRARLTRLDVNAKENRSMTARQLFAARSGVPPDTAASFECLLRSLTETESTGGHPGEASSDEEDFFDALEYASSDRYP